MDITRREILTLSTIGVAGASLGLLGCGGEGGGGTTIAGNFQVDRNQVGGDQLFVPSCEGEPPALPAVGTGIAVGTTQLSETEVTLIPISDHLDELRSLSVHLPGGLSRSPSLTFDAKECAKALLFLSPGIMAKEPEIAAERLGLIEQLPSFAALQACLLRKLPLQTLPEAMDDETVGYLKACCIEYGLPSQDRSAASLWVFPTWTNEGSNSKRRIKVENAGWRIIKFDVLGRNGGGQTIGSSSGPKYMLGAEPASWSSLFLLDAGKPSSREFDVDFATFPQASSVDVWVRGPGKAGEPVPHSLGNSTDAILLTVIYYVLLPLADLVSSGSEALKLIQGSSESTSSALLNLAKGSSVGSAVNELTDQIDRALSKGDGWEAAKLVLALLLSLIEIIEILLKRLGFSQLQILKAKLVLNYISVIFGAVNLIGATTSWLRLEGNGRATLPVDRPQNFVVVDQGKGAPAFDWTLNTAGLLIPMGEYRMSLQVGGDKAPGITKATLPLGWTAYALHVMHKLNNSVNIPNGTLVGRLIATCEGGITLRKDLIAGENTAEWAWEREDKLGNRPKHNLPSTPYAQPITDGGVNFNIRHFYTKIGTSGSDGPLRVEHLQLEMYAHPAASKLGIDIYALTIEEAKLRSRPR